MLGLEKVPKITDMLIVILIPRIQMYMINYVNLQMKVQEVYEHLHRASGYLKEN